MKRFLACLVCLSLGRVAYGSAYAYFANPFYGISNSSFVYTKTVARYDDELKEWYVYPPSDLRSANCSMSDEGVNLYVGNWDAYVVSGSFVTSTETNDLPPYYHKGPDFDDIDFPDEFPPPEEPPVDPPETPDPWNPGDPLPLPNPPSPPLPDNPYPSPPGDPWNPDPSSPSDPGDPAPPYNPNNPNVPPPDVESPGDSTWAERYLKAIQDNTWMSREYQRADQSLQQYSLNESQKQSHYLESMKEELSKQSAYQYTSAESLREAVQNQQQANQYQAAIQQYLEMMKTDSGDIRSGLASFKSGFDSWVIESRGSTAEDLAFQDRIALASEASLQSVQNLLANHRDTESAWTVFRNMITTDTGEMKTSFAAFQTGLDALVLDSEGYHSDSLAALENVRQAAQSSASATEGVGQKIVDLSGQLTASIGHLERMEAVENEAKVIMGQIRDSAALSAAHQENANQLLDAIKTGVISQANTGEAQLAAANAYIGIVESGFADEKTVLDQIAYLLTDQGLDQVQVLNALQNLNSRAQGLIEESQTGNTEAVKQTSLLEEISEKSWSVTNDVSVTVTNQTDVSGIKSRLDDLISGLGDMGTDDGAGFSASPVESDLPEPLQVEIDSINEMGDTSFFRGVIDRLKVAIRNFFSLNLPEVGRKTVWTVQLPSLFSLEFPPLVIDLSKFPSISIVRQLLVISVVIATIFRAQKMIAGIFS